jgi:FixJ family two-component response regulator
MTRGRSAATQAPLALVVDDDEIVREALQDLLRSVGIETWCFASTRELLEARWPDRPKCLILDVRIPGGSGLELQAQLRASGQQLPIIFMTGHGDIAMGVQAMKAGAVNFLTKPFRDQDILDAVSEAIERDRLQREAIAIRREVEARTATLTSREQQILEAVALGILNKQIAAELGISVATVKMHRGNVMRKMQVRSVAELFRALACVKSTGVHSTVR